MLLRAKVSIPDNEGVEDFMADVSYYYYPECIGNDKFPYEPPTIEIMFVARYGESIMDELSGGQFDYIEDFLLEEHLGDDGYEYRR